MCLTLYSKDPLINFKDWEVHASIFIHQNMKNRFKYMYLTNGNSNYINPVYIFNLIYKTTNQNRKQLWLNFTTMTSTQVQENIVSIPIIANFKSLITKSDCFVFL